MIQRNCQKEVEIVQQLLLSDSLLQAVENQAVENQAVENQANQVNGVMEEEDQDNQDMEEEESEDKKFCQTHVLRDVMTSTCMYTISLSS